MSKPRERPDAIGEVEGSNPPAPPTLVPQRIRSSYGVIESPPSPLGISIIGSKISHLDDFAKKLTKAKEKTKEGFVNIHVLSPCVMGWCIKTDMSIHVCRMVVRTN